MGTRHRILVADDDLELLGAISAAVAAPDIDVVPVANGADLVQRVAEEEPFDLIITDVAMPWMSGLHVAQATRSAGMRTPIIVITALASPEVARQVAQLGDSATLLRKPFELEDLRALAATMLARAAPGGTSA